MTDIVERLKILYATHPICQDAAAEIELLRSQVANAKGYVDRAIASYNGDPADNQFQKGFLAALEVIRDEAFTPVTSTEGL